MKKITISLLVIFLLIPANLYAASDKKIDHSKNGYDLYKERVSKSCNSYKDSKVIYRTKRYEDQEKIKDIRKLKNNFDLDYAKETYRENMNNIYKCSIIGVKRNSYKIITTQLTKNTKNTKLSSLIKNNIKKNITKLDMQYNSIGCKSIDGLKGFNIKKIILDQTTYELCKYNYYLEYLKENNNDLGKIVQANQNLLDLKNNNNTHPDVKAITDNYSSVLNTSNSFGINKVLKLQNEKIQLINDEIENSYKVFPIAYNAYSDYENSITTHHLLEIIKYDYITLRESLHKSLSPINQVVYKINNAMKK